MQRVAGAMVALGLIFGTAAAFAQPAPKKVEKSRRAED